MNEYKTCARCGQIKSLDNFPRASRAKDGLNWSCRECVNLINRLSYQKNKVQISARRKTNATQKAKNLVISNQWIKDNPERAKKLWSDWAKNNPDRGRIKNAARRSRVKNAITYTVIGKDMRTLLRGPCFYCQAKGSMSLDHVVPLSRGGTHGIGNLVAACKSCNSSKRDRFITEWQKSQRLDLD
jgi:5-methylcytosine-specific restriction endonuclease McrA